MLKVQVCILIAMTFCGKLWGLDEFAGVKCSSNISQALIGRSSVNRRASLIEAAHKDIGLKNLGGDEISDRLFLESWLICGREFELLVDRKSNVIHDALPFPPHSKSSPESSGPCQLGDQPIREAVIAVLDNSAGFNARDLKLARTLLKVKAAWKIDEISDRFVALPIDGLVCQLGGVITLDGGP